MSRTPGSGKEVGDLYPIGEKHPERLRTRGGRPWSELTLAKLLAGEVTRTELGITPQGLRHQALVARRVGRTRLALNFERGAELVEVPDELILEIYERLRPGRASHAGELRELAARLRRDHGADRVAALIEEAAAVYERRGLFRRRF